MCSVDESVSDFLVSVNFETFSKIVCHAPNLFQRKFNSYSTFAIEGNTVLGTKPHLPDGAFLLPKWWNW